MCLDKNFTTAENIALYTLTELLKDCKRTYIYKAIFSHAGGWTGD